MIWVSLWFSVVKKNFLHRWKYKSESVHHKKFPNPPEIIDCVSKKL